MKPPKPIDHLGRVRNRGYGRPRKLGNERKSKYRVIDGIRAHRLLVEQRTGMKLPDYAIVHHVDPNDKATNQGLFVVCENQAYHALLEIRGRALRECGNANWLKCKVCGKYDDPANLVLRARRNSAKKVREGHFDRAHVLIRGRCVDKGTPKPKGLRVAKARDEGIWKAIGENQVRCIICGLEMVSATFTRAAHARVHVKDGRAVARTIPAPAHYRKPGTTRTIYELAPEIMSALAMRRSSSEER